MAKKETARERSKRKIRRKLSGTGQRPRLTVFKSNRVTYAQLIDDEKGVTLCSANSVEADIAGKRSALDEKGGRTESSKGTLSAFCAGILLGERAKKLGVDKVLFDRNGYPYHGRVASVADGARQSGLVL